MGKDNKKGGKNGAKLSKAAEKKRDRLALEKLMNSRVALVKKANEQVDPLDLLPSFKKFNKNNLGLTLSTERVTKLDEETKTWIVDLITRNMRTLYEESSWGWDPANKKEELLDDHAWYMLARTDDEERRPVAFSHFRYDMDYDDEVLYVYEIQLENECQRKGLGKFMMMALELLAFKADMRKIMATVFKHNKGTVKFFKGAMKYEIDETCPIDDVYEQFDYEIISKFNKRKLAEEEKAKQEAENEPAGANLQKCC